MTTAPAPASGAPRCRPGRLSARYPAAGVQTRFWLLHELFPDAPLCNEGIALRLRGQLDVDGLQGTLVAIVQRHESLRASFQQSTAGVMVHIAPAAAVPFEQVNLEAADPDSRQRLLEGIARTATAGRFDLSAPPLLRATLVREAPDSHVLLLVFHHIIADGTSFLKLFPAELAELYPALRDGRTPVPLPPVTSYRDFVRASLGDEQRARVDPDLRVLAGGAGGRAALPAAAHRSSLSRPSQRPGRAPGAAAAARGSPAGTAAGRTSGRCGPFDVTAAAFVALLGRYSEEEEVVLGTPIANRGPTFKHTIGCFINALVLRTPLRDDQRFQDLISELGQIRREARHHAQVPFGELIDHLGGARDAARNPIYQVMFNYLDFSLDDLRIEGLAGRGLAGQRRHGDAGSQPGCHRAERRRLPAVSGGQHRSVRRRARRTPAGALPGTAGGRSGRPDRQHLASWVSSRPPSGRKSPRWRAGRRCRRRSPKTNSKLGCRFTSWSPCGRGAGAIGWRCDPSSGRSPTGELVAAFQAVGEGLQRQGVVGGRAGAGGLGATIPATP